MADRRATRVAALRESLTTAHIDALVITSLPNVRYLTGFSGSSALLLVTQRDLHFITDFRYDTQVRDEVGDLAAVRIESQSLWTGLWNLMGSLSGIEVVGFESGHLLHRDFQRLLTEGTRWQWRPQVNLVEALRESKDADEVALIRKAGEMAIRALRKTLKEVRHGLTELNVAGILEKALRDEGSEDFPFATIVASGPRAALPHARASSRVIERGDLLLVDFGAQYHGYCSDITRTVVVGKATTEQREIYEIVRHANSVASKMVRAGMKGQDADGLARRYIEEHDEGRFEVISVPDDNRSVDIAIPPVASLQAIQLPIRDKLEDVSRAMGEIVASDLPLVGQVSAHLLAMRGKLFRPTLLLLSSEVEGAPKKSAVTVAAALELIHLATLVHDDAVDHSALRRGMPTVNALFSHQISVIMGDFLYSTALTHLVQLGDLEALQALTRASTEMTLGEMRQLAVTDPLKFTEREYYALIRSKTASLMRTACELGALSGARRYCEALGSFGENLGMAFQIADDLLDYREVKETTGKPSGLDLREHKVTLPLIHALREMSTAARKEVERLFASETVSDGDIASVVAIVAENGGFEYAREREEEFAERAHDALSELPDTVARRSLSASISYVMERHS